MKFHKILMGTGRKRSVNIPKAEHKNMASVISFLDLISEEFFWW